MNNKIFVQLITHIYAQLHTNQCDDDVMMFNNIINIIIVITIDWMWMNRQAREALGDRIRNSLQRTALRLKLSRLLSVQALTLHYPWLTANNIETFVSESILPDPNDMYGTWDNLNGVDEYENIGMYAHPSIITNAMRKEPIITVVLARLQP